MGDAGAERNDGMGAAFSMLGGTSTSTLDPMIGHPRLDLFVGEPTATGDLLEHAFNDGTRLARITARRVPE